jgi:hypothetical protein
MKALRVLLPLLAFALVLSSCAAKLPQAEVDAAQKAFADAQAAQAEALAPESFKAANDANTALNDNLNAKAYGKTKKLAKALLDASTKASADAAAGLEAAKANVAQLGTDIAAEVESIQKNLKAAVAKKAKIDAKAIKAALAAEPKALADAQALTDVVSAQKALQDLKAQLDGFKAELEAAGFAE